MDDTLTGANSKSQENLDFPWTIIFCDDQPDKRVTCKKRHQPQNIASSPNLTGRVRSHGHHSRLKDLHIISMG